MLKLFELVPKTGLTRTVFFLAGDIILIALAVFLAFFLRFEGAIPEFYFKGTLQITIVLALGILIPIFFFFRLYAFSWAYASTRELWSLFRGVTAGFLLLGLAVILFQNNTLFLQFPRSTLVISYLLTFLFTGALRLAKRIYIYAVFSRPTGKKTRVLIVGAGDAGEQLVRNMLQLGGILTPVCFVDDDPFKRGTLIHGVEVMGKITQIPEIVQKEQIEEMIIAIPSASSDLIKTAVELGRKAELKKIRILPPLQEIIAGNISLRDVREVDVEDLLPRTPISIDTSQVREFIKGKVVLITGAAGSIGSELSRQIAKFSPGELILLDQDETGIFNISEELRNLSVLNVRPLVADITDEKSIKNIFEKFKPQLVFHAAAYKHVPLLEENAPEAVKNNVFGTKIVAEAAIGAKVQTFVFISTDKAVNPSSIMGATKRIGEMICQMLNQRNSTRFVSVRFGNVLNTRGSVIPIFKEQIKKGGPVEVTHPDMERYFMLTSEACLLVMQAGAMGRGGEVFVLDMGKPIKIVDLAREMIRLSGFEPDKDIPIVFVGKRPGEKLSEEILTNQEGTIATEKERILIAKLTPVNVELLKDALEKLKDATDRESIIKILKVLIPSYEPDKAGII